jgi:hypothetical protein
MVMHNKPTVRWVHSTHLISDQTYKLLNVLCDYESFVHSSPQCDKILDIANTEAGNVASYSIFTPTCHASFASSKNKVMKRLHSAGNMGERYDPCTEKHSTVYFNLAEVQKALHVNPVIGKSKWATCSEAVNAHWGTAKDLCCISIIFFKSVLDTCFIKRGKSWYNHSYAVNNGELPRAPHRHTLTQITGLTVELKERTKNKFCDDGRASRHAHTQDDPVVKAHEPLPASCEH